jgi:NDP-sugar pyrophosphorylase family protein
MKAVILAGGLGSRLSEETTLRPKPMIEIGGKPILWHIMKTYACHGINEFIVALGYKAEVVKDYFLRSMRSTTILRLTSLLEQRPFIRTVIRQIGKCTLLILVCTPRREDG